MAEHSEWQVIISDLTSVLHQKCHSAETAAHNVFLCSKFMLPILFEWLANEKSAE